MSRRKQLRCEAIQLRRRIDHRGGLVRLRVGGLMHKARDLARAPAALPIAFVCGILAERLYVPGMKHISEMLANQVETVQLASSFIGSSGR